MTNQLANLGVKDEKELATKVEKLRELFRVLTNGKEGDLNIPDTLSRVQDFEKSSQAFISTLLVSLAAWIAPNSTIAETDFVTRLIKQMAQVDKDRKSKAEAEFLGRVRSKQQEKEAKSVANMIAFARMESEGCIFKPAKRIPCPDMRTPVPIQPPRVRSEKLPTVFDRHPVVSRLAVPHPSANRTDVTPEEINGLKLTLTQQANWASSLRREEYQPMDKKAVDPENPDDVAMTQSGKRASVYENAMHRMPVRTVGTQGYIPRTKSWQDELRGGYRSTQMNTSPIDFGCRTRLHECMRKQFNAYSPPKSTWQPIDYDVIRKMRSVPGVGLSQPEPVERGTVLCRPGGVHDHATMEARLPDWVQAAAEVSQARIGWNEAPKAVEMPCM
jgi:hypothetical protein